MSYEGYTQHICVKGHYYANGPGFPDVCALCDSPAAWSNEVDDTNHDGYGQITQKDLAQFLINGEITCVCSCGHEHAREYETYRIPTPEETLALRSYRIETGLWKRCTPTKER